MHITDKIDHNGQLCQGLLSLPLVNQIITAQLNKTPVELYSLSIDTHELIFFSLIHFEQKNLKWYAATWKSADISPPKWGRWQERTQNPVTSWININQNSEQV